MLPVNVIKKAVICNHFYAWAVLRRLQAILNHLPAKFSHVIRKRDAAGTDALVNVESIVRIIARERRVTNDEFENHDTE